MYSDTVREVGPLFIQALNNAGKLNS